MLRTLILLQLTVAFPAEGALVNRLRKQQVATDSGLWKPCASENEAITQSGLVRFGFGETWVQRTAPRGATCSLATFGSDPVPGILKMCECTGEDSSDLSQNVVKDDMQLSWARCAKEGEQCACDSGTVRFGSVTKWVVKEKGFAKGQQLACSPAGFDGLDPAASQTKECWCLASEKADPKPPSVAIVLLSRRAPDLKTWLQYHLDYMGVRHVFMDVEDTPDFASVWSSLSQASKDRVTVWRTNSTSKLGDKRPVDDYTTLQARQLVAMRHAKAASKDMGIDWLLHIDDDELLYTPLHRPIGEILESVPQGFDQAYIPNVEAVYDSPDVKSCFTETSTVNMDRYSFVSYANGKAAVRVADGDAQPAGPHQWRTSDGIELSSIHLDAETFGSPVWLVHFESCPFTRWEDKYWELGNTSPDKVQKIPFPWYRESISRFMECRSRSKSGEVFAQMDGACSQSSLKTLWSHWKTRQNPRIKPKELMPITIPWQKIKAEAK